MFTGGFDELSPSAGEQTGEAPQVARPARQQGKGPARVLPLAVAQGRRHLREPLPEESLVLGPALPNELEELVGLEKAPPVEMAHRAVEGLDDREVSKYVAITGKYWLFCAAFKNLAAASISKNSSVFFLVCLVALGLR